ncbi:MAG TPA: peptidase MA family metallohydrolase, partial [Anaerolineae bacterium]|nr:peptidase MA family metallohydrolase [Anaerolineae bacterium]
EIRAIMPSEPPSPLRIYVYPTAADLRAGLRLTGRDWVGAHARPELGVILVSAGSPVTAATDLARTIPHELVHLYLYQATGVGYESMPLWLDEGLASLLESELNPIYATRLEEATASGETIALDDLCYTLPADDDAVLLAYAQSAAIIRHIQSQYGNQALKQMIVELADGADCHSVTERGLGISLAALNQDWLDQEAPQSLLQRVWRNGRVGLAIIIAGFLLLALLVGLPKGRKS